MNCGICKKRIATTFLDKPLGTFVKDAAGKRHSVCFECQKQFQEKALLLQKLR